MAAMPNSLLTVTLASNFGTFLLYALSCIICLVGFHNHKDFKPLRHLVIPVFGLLANLACMAFYLIGPFMGYGTRKEPLLALGIAIVWGALRRNLLHGVQQEERQDDTGGTSAGALPLKRSSIDRTAAIPSLAAGPDFRAAGRGGFLCITGRRGIMFAGCCTHPFLSMLDLEFAELTDVGRVRDHNEDYSGHALPSSEH